MNSKHGCGAVQRDSAAWKPLPLSQFSLDIVSLLSGLACVAISVPISHGVKVRSARLDPSISKARLTCRASIPASTLASAGDQVERPRRPQELQRMRDITQPHIGFQSTHGY